MRPEEVVHGREEVRAGDAIRKINGKAQIAGPERVTSLAIFHRIAPMLLYSVHGEAAGAIEPMLLTRALEQLQKRVAISCSAMTETWSLARRPGLPNEFASAE